jgi:hypothetical protein
MFELKPIAPKILRHCISKQGSFSLGEFYHLEFENVVV